MKKLLAFAGILLGSVLLLALGVYVWAGSQLDRSFARTIETHTVDFPIPFPLSPEELEALGVEADPGNALARERALERGRHLISARYPCTECHGANLAGGVMVDAFPLGSLLGPNLTGGQGGRVSAYTTADWDRAVRHGVLPDGTPSVMPAEDFLRMSDQELSDLIVYIQSLPPVDNEVPPPSFGPLGRLLVATGQHPASADLIGDHAAAHPVVPPPAAATVEFGEHLAGVCVGCHGMEFAGGPIAGGDPSWPPARNLTPHPTGLAGWSYEDFVVALRDGVRPDGAPVLPPMTLVQPYAREMTEVEVQALWAFLQSLPPVPTP